MTTPEQIPYDEMRRILGLPDIRAEVQWQRAELAFRQIGVAMSEFVEAIKPMMAKFTDAVQQQQQQRHRPPMWAIDPTQTRRANSNQHSGKAARR